MPFTYVALTQPDRERMESLKIMIDWTKPHADHWSIDRDTGDFLVRIAQDREPPHYDRYALWWRNMLYKVEIEPNSSPATGYRLDVVGVADVSSIPGKGIPRSDWPALGVALFEATKAHAIGRASKLIADLREKKGLPTAASDAPPMQMQSTSVDLSKSPCIIFRTDFPKEIL
jgi:hypothetical protein